MVCPECGKELNTVLTDKEIKDMVMIIPNIIKTW